MFVITAAFSMLAFAGCSHGSLDNKVDREAARETSVKTNADLQNEASQLIKTEPGLSDDQRTKLLALQSATQQQMNTNRAQSLQLRSLMMKDMVKTDYDPNEMETVKKKIRDNENQRLSLTFDAMDKAQKIMGRSTNGHVMESMMWDRHEDTRGQ
jgi:hypothetical protein